MNSRKGKRPNIGTELVNAVAEYLTYGQKMKKYCYWRNNSGALKTATGGFVRFGTPGSPDFIVVKDGYFIGLEVKAGSGRLSEAQKAFRDMIKQNGGEYYEIRAVTGLKEIGL